MRQNVGIVRGIWKENDIRNGDEGSPGYGILVEKERECRIRAPGSRSYQQLLKMLLSRVKAN